MAQAAESALGVTENQEMLVTFPQPVGDQSYDNRINYFIDVLDLAMRASGRKYRLTPYQVPMTTAGRSRQNILQGYYDVAWIHTSMELEKTLHPVRIPLLKGLIGWRLFFIRSDDAHKFGRVSTLDDLRGFIAGQGYDYPDNVILEASNFPLRTGLHRNNVLQMLLKKRVDYFPRSITEIYDEWQVFAEPGLSIEQTLALRYPSAFYFFVDKRNEELAKVIEGGLQIAISSGEFDKLFYKYFGDIIERSRLDERTVLNIPHPALSNTIPLRRQGYWFQPSITTGKR